MHIAFVSLGLAFDDARLNSRVLCVKVSLKAASRYLNEYLQAFSTSSGRLGSTSLLPRQSCLEYQTHILPNLHP